jgi:hypothetical protein
MPGVGGIRVDYTDGNGLQHTFSKYIATTGDASTFLAGDGTTIDLATATPVGSNDNAGQAIRAFLKAYEWFAPTGSSIRNLSADFRATGGPGIVDATATFNWSGFTPEAGGAGYGPFPTGFVAYKARALESHRPGWLRFYTTGQSVFTKHTVFAPNLLDDSLADWLLDLTTFSGMNVNYAVWSGTDSDLGAWEGFTPYNVSSGRIGAKNG